MQLVIARDVLLEQILDYTYGVWHEGLTRKAYGQRNIAQVRTEWGSARLQRLALVDDHGRLLSSAKCYRLDAVLDGQPARVCGIGAVFTPPPLRGRGYASQLIELMLERERDGGAHMAALFSEIGASFYERLSFSRVTLDEVTVHVKLKGGTPAVLARAGHDGDLPALAAMHEKRSMGARFALRRDPAFIHHWLAKKRLLAGLGPQGLRQVEFYVVEEGASAVAYVVLSVDAHGWTLDEAGDRDPAGARLGALLQLLAAREPSQRTPTIRAWWPRGFPVPPQLELTNRIDARDVLMMRPLSEVVLPAGPDDTFYWRGDFF